MCQHHYYHSPCFIVPPHILEVLAVRGDEETRSMANQLLQLCEEPRNERNSFMVRSADREFKVPELEENAAITDMSVFQVHTTHSGTGPKRKIYNGNSRADLPGDLIRSEGDPPSNDPDADAAYDGAGDVFELYSGSFGRDSLDNAGMDLVATVHHRRDYGNAFWNGNQMAYGDGDGQIFTSLTELSIIGHEMSHGVVQHSGGLFYQDQSGALNESFADVFGALTVQKKLSHTASEASWLIGEGILGPNVRGTALRSLKAPGTAYSDALLGQDPQPYHMDFYVNTTRDRGGVHINSGIPNQAFYLYSSYLGGNAWERAGQVWYHALQALNNPLATFQNWAEQTTASALAIYKPGSLEVTYLRRAWRLVGIAV